VRAVRLAGDQDGRLMSSSPAGLSQTCRRGGMSARGRGCDQPAAQQCEHVLALRRDRLDAVPDRRRCSPRATRGILGFLGASPAKTTPWIRRTSSTSRVGGGPTRRRACMSGRAGTSAWPTTRGGGVRGSSPTPRGQGGVSSETTAPTGCTDVRRSGSLRREDDTSAVAKSVVGPSGATTVGSDLARGASSVAPAPLRQCIARCGRTGVHVAAGALVPCRCGDGAVAGDLERATRMARGDGGHAFRIRRGAGRRVLPESQDR